MTRFKWVSEQLRRSGLTRAGELTTSVRLDGARLTSAQTFSTGTQAM